MLSALVFIIYMEKITLKSFLKMELKIGIEKPTRNELFLVDDQYIPRISGNIKTHKTFNTGCENYMKIGTFHRATLEIA